MLRRTVLAAAMLIVSAFASGRAASPAAPDWPSPAQIAHVDQKCASFPSDRYVHDIDWYQPQEKVRGAAHTRPLGVRAPSTRTITATALAKAVAYADLENSYALLVWHAGALELAHYAPGFDRRSRYETASMHKTVLALALGAAVAAGKINSVDDPIAMYLPALAGTRRGGLPLRAYLEMRSGIETPPDNGSDDSPFWQYYVGDDMWQASEHWPDGCKALTQFCYANANTQLLGYALSAATGMRYADWLSRTIWRPIGAAGATLWLDHPGGMPRVSCCLMASAEDWTRIGVLLLDRGKAGGRLLVPPDWVARMSAQSAANPNYGWQMWLGSPHNRLRHYGPNIALDVPAKEPFARDDVVYLDGWGGQRVYVVPSARLVIVRIGAPSFDWDDSRLPNLVLAGISESRR